MTYLSGHAGPGTSLLEVDDLRTVFTTAKGPLPALDGVSFTLQHGETLGVVGESGSGKTVLARSVMGLLPRDGVERSGSVLFEGRQLVGAPEREMRNLWGARISMVFQDPSASLNPVVRVGKQIAEPLRVHLRMRRADAMTQAVAMLDQVGIPSPEIRARTYPGQLSGGMRQRVVIAIALACAPRLLLADEPTTGLDATVQTQILDLLATMQEERRMALMLVTHDLGVVASRADRILVMYAGRVVEQAATRTVLTSPAMPYTEALLRSTPRLAEPSHTRLAVIEGHPPDPMALPPGCAFAPRCRYAQERCHREAPPLAEGDDPTHRYACWYPLGGRLGRRSASGPVR